MLSMEWIAGELRTTTAHVSWWKRNKCFACAIPELTSAQSRETKMRCELREVDLNVKVLSLRALWSSHRRDSHSRGLFWQRSPAVWNLQLYLVMSNHMLDSATSISLLRLWDDSREYCFKAKLFFWTPSMLLKSTYLFERIVLFYELWSPFRKRGPWFWARKSNAEWSSTYSRSQGHFTQQNDKLTVLRSLWDLWCS